MVQESPQLRFPGRKLGTPNRTGSDMKVRTHGHPHATGTNAASTWAKYARPTQSRSWSCDGSCTAWYRYRLHRRDLPGKPDLVFPARRKVILVHGCFWHRHGDPACRLARLPKSRLDFWLPKLSANEERDARTAARLAELGWEVMTVWECQVRDAEALKSRIREFLDP